MLIRSQTEFGNEKVPLRSAYVISFPISDWKRNVRISASALIRSQTEFGNEKALLRSAYLISFPISDWERGVQKLRFDVHNRRSLWNFSTSGGGWLNFLSRGCNLLNFFCRRRHYGAEEISFTRYDALTIAFGKSIFNLSFAADGAGVMAPICSSCL